MATFFAQLAPGWPFNVEEVEAPTASIRTVPRPVLSGGNGAHFLSAVFSFGGWLDGSCSERREFDDSFGHRQPLCCKTPLLDRP